MLTTFEPEAVRPASPAGAFMAAWNAATDRVDTAPGMPLRRIGGSVGGLYPLGDGVVFLDWWAAAAPNAGYADFRAMVDMAEETGAAVARVIGIKSRMAPWFKRFGFTETGRGVEFVDFIFPGLDDGAADRVARLRAAHEADPDRHVRAAMRHNTGRVPGILRGRC